MIDADDIGTVAIVGAGSIGASWAALVLARGLTVIATDPARGALESLPDAVGARLAELGAVADWRGRLHFTADPAEAAAAADLVLENGPERLVVKREIFAVLDAAARPDVLLASSSSGLAPSSFQGVCRYPERVLVAHPFNPPHLVPLVEIVGGEQTSAAAIATAMAVMRHWGKEPVHIRRELPGHVANRLQAALWREAYYLVEQGVVSVADIDTAISAGPGLRWALLGPFATQHLSGGPGGLGHVLEHLGPPMVDWWADLGSPKLTSELMESLVTGVAEELGDIAADELPDRRDRALRDLLSLKDRHGLG
ncbi:3-hydroxyacyl-CoA dehydrogenase NAD-binding domain-containing protein [Nocardia crassostreae]|uniref:3-hydroxyacyl-CoA dehydrogenase NAD-binding domain-containing protein n=1 Tax=Nocardia crassostreae TaxID=53428 RepID=UPI00082A0836|nr:3-hydroxyacyl-CoA dehydrogenase NAD-binding domain-containing protein [Nocardia crassostreae]